MNEPADSTQDITIPLDAGLFREAVTLAQAAERLRGFTEDIPAGKILNALDAAIIRVTANAEVLGELAKEVGEFWPKKTEVPE